jgi:hypothetical protein
MRIDQRNAGASVSVSGGAYTLDRWVYDPSASLSWFTFQQNGGAVTPPAGFSNYLGITSTGANTPTSGQFTLVSQYIEGFNTADLNWGTANAKTVTLSYWVRSSLTGTFGGTLSNGAYNRGYPFSYTISSANTWEYKSVTIAGDTSGTWTTTNTLGIELVFSLGMGSNLNVPANTWTSGWRFPTGAVSVVGTNGAPFYITGVQLEVGSTATSFDYLDYGRCLIQCQRYFQTIGGLPAIGNYYVNTQVNGVCAFPVQMRATPTISATGALTVTDTIANYTQSVSGVSYSTYNQYASTVVINNLSGITAFRPYFYASSESSNRLLTFSAEL